MVNFNCKLVHDTLKVPHSVGELFVHPNHLTPIGDAVGFTSDDSKSLQQLSCEDGIASKGSIPDGYGMKVFRRLDDESEVKSQLVAALAEVKHTVDSRLDTPDESLLQAFSEATNASLSHVKFGVPVEDVRVPIWSSNGQMMKFAVLRLLKPAFPYLEILTHDLVLSRLSDRLEAASVLAHIRAWLHESHSFRGSQSLSAQMGLSTQHYFLKPLTQFFSVLENRDQGLSHMFRVLERLEVRAC